MALAFLPLAIAIRGLRRALVERMAVPGRLLLMYMADVARVMGALRGMENRWFIVAW